MASNDVSRVSLSSKLIIPIKTICVEHVGLYIMASSVVVHLSVNNLLSIFRSFIDTNQVEINLGDVIKDEAYLPAFNTKDETVCIEEKYVCMYIYMLT